MRISRVGDCQIAGRRSGGGGAELTLLLNHFDGSDGVTEFLDEVPGVVWEQVGGGELDTAKAAFGPSSLLVSGNDVQALGIAVPVGGDWTVEGWVNFGAGTVLAHRLRNSSDQNRMSFLVAGTKVYNVVYVDSGGSGILTQSGSVTYTLDSWAHYAVVREGTSYSFFFDGNMVETDVSATNIGDSDRLFVEGATGGTWHDEIRVSAFARYSGATYIIPVAPFTLD